MNGKNLSALILFFSSFIVLECASSKNSIKIGEINEFLSKKQNGWQKEKDNDNIQVYSRLHEGLLFKEYKVETVVEATVVNILALFVDYPAGCEWIDRCAEMSLVKEINLKKRIFYFEMSMPTPLSNRYALIDSYIHLNTETKVLIIDLKMLDQVKKRSTVSHEAL